LAALLAVLLGVIVSGRVDPAEFLPAVVMSGRSFIIACVGGLVGSVGAGIALLLPNDDQPQPDTLANLFRQRHDLLDAISREESELTKAQQAGKPITGRLEDSLVAHRSLLA
jgi:hypothetical protein